MTNSNKTHTPLPAPMAMMAYSGRARSGCTGGEGEEVVLCGGSDEGAEVGGVVVGTDVGCVFSGPDMRNRCYYNCL